MTEKELDEKLKNVDWSDCKIENIKKASQDPQQQNKSISNIQPVPDQQQKPTKKIKNSDSGTKKVNPGTKIETRGRKNRGLTEKHRIEDNEFRRTLLNMSSPDNFNNDVIEHVNGEIITDGDLIQFKELYHLTCVSILDKFREDHPELVTKHPYMWYKKLLIDLKKAVPAVNYKELDKLIIVWDCLTWLMNEIGLYITFETFSLFTHVYSYQLENMEELSPKYRAFRQKINNERDNALVNEISYNPYNSTNKIFLAKCHGIIEKTEPKQIEVHHDIRNYGNLPMFAENSENQN